MLKWTCVIAIVLAGSNGGDSDDPRMLERIAKTAVEKIVGHILDAPVKTESVRLNLKEEQVELRNVVIGNPKGYGEGEAIAAESVLVEANVKSLFSDTPMVRLIDVKAPRINAVTSFKGVNLMTILNNAKGSQRSGKRQAQGKPKQWRIVKGVMGKAEVTFSGPIPGGQAMKKSIEPIEMDFAGENGEGVTAQQALAKFFARIAKELNLVGSEETLGGLSGLVNIL